MKLFKTFKLYYLPRIVAVWFLSACILVYILALRNNRVRPFLPFISECGMTPPESCIFAQFFNLGAVLMAIIGYIRYQQVNIAIKSKTIHLPIIWNELSFWTGAIICIGVTIAANFQARFALLIHLIGANMIFGTGAVYIIIQTRITAAFVRINYNEAKSAISNSTLYYLRIFISFSYCIASLSTVVLFEKAVGKYDFEANNIFWNEEDTDMKIRTLAAIAEWLTVFIFLIYTLTMSEDLKHIEFEEVRFKTQYAAFTNNIKKKKVK
ncbi:hypothetical protein ILUMI_09955 [Ignelater luminosus]|uniref:CWH43-like N-terminal domain-containing protein n=1 Tax=Ignelater luminosus TaxID=2038154 RepID=A0A8K0GFG2_IGNLU|nr:hypothetical protein ILUMI_09955 [Ignelater luminosus]